MDFIEQIFGFSPDGGSGAFEVLLFLIPIAGLVILYRRRAKARQDRRR
jgi:cbb3-type cytochrome oxidase subunit 3